MGRRNGAISSTGRTLRSSKNARTPSSWTLLLVEVRLIILEQLSRQQHRGWTSCAAVCKEWQAFVEPKNFYRLRLKASCLDEFEHMAKRRRDLVKHLWLNIELPRYTCRCCQRSPGRSAYPPPHIHALFRNAVVKLFSVLSTWQPTGDLVLELNAYSPSDSEH